MEENKQKKNFNKYIIIALIILLILIDQLSKLYITESRNSFRGCLKYTCYRECIGYYLC